MTIRWAIIVASILMAAQGNAQLLTGISSSATGGGTPSGACSNSLDFSQSCNSQYLGIGVF